MPEANDGPDTGASGRRARALAEQAMHAQAAGRDAEADRLFTAAQQMDPDAVAAVLAEHDAALAPDARDQPTADHDADRLARPAGDAASYPGSTGPSGGRREQP
ncbi:MAG: hypothetical protein JO157_18630 [Acetobacteraceae bacterium]|nr:hypothetical protein [Acetobacteraceae bacterium]